MKKKTERDREKKREREKEKKRKIKINRLAPKKPESVPAKNECPTCFVAKGVFFVKMWSKLLPWRNSKNVETKETTFFKFCKMTTLTDFFSGKYPSQHRHVEHSFFARTYSGVFGRSGVKWASWREERERQ